jgi:hypothetical protein
MTSHKWSVTGQAYCSTRTDMRIPQVTYGYYTLYGYDSKLYPVFDFHLEKNPWCQDGYSAYKNQLHIQFWATKKFETVQSVHMSGKPPHFFDGIAPRMDVNR